MNIPLFDWMAAGMILLGMGILTLAVIGMVRLGDYHLRLHAAGMAGVMGVIPLLAACLLIGDGPVMSRAGLTIVFVLLTAPASLHALALAGSRQVSDSGTVHESTDRPGSTRHPCTPDCPAVTDATDES